MQKKPAKSIDGFVRRHRPSETLDSSAKPKSSSSAPRLSLDNKVRRTDKFQVEPATPQLDPDPSSPKKSSRRDKKDKKPKKKRSLARRIITTILFVLGLAIIGVVIYFGVLSSSVINRIFEGGVTGLFRRDRLEADANGRTNILIFGDDFEGYGDEDDGVKLTDSIMVVSIHQDKRDAYMISIPRDLWVRLEEPCIVGYQARINTQFFCSSNNGEDIDAGARALMNVVSRVTGLEMHYYVSLNFTAFVDIVDAVGGVEIVIESSDPRGIFDRNFDWMCPDGPHTCYFVKYPNGPTGLMDGQHALALARARGEPNACAIWGCWGLANSNFDREIHQQKLIAAIFDRVVSTGTITNLSRVTQILNALGDNLRTNISTNKIRTFMDLGSDASSRDAQSINLIDPEEPMMTTGTISGQSVVFPVAGTFEYSALHNFIRRQIASGSNPLIKENARLAVYNASDISGLAGRLADQLTEQHLSVTRIANTSHRSLVPLEIFVANTSMTATLSHLEQHFRITARPASELPPELANTNADFILVISAESAL